MPFTESADAGFYAMVHELLEAQSPTRGDERRDRTRYEYPCMQLVAPFDGDQLPTQADFQVVRCHDLSPAGFSFFLPHPPHYARLIVALGKMPFTFLVAEVRFVEPVESDEGDISFRVGCRFERRL